jgi:hypothetical protein
MSVALAKSATMFYVCSLMFFLGSAERRVGSAFSIFAVKGAYETMLPVVIFDEGDKSHVSRDLAVFALFLSNRGDSYERIHGACRACGMLYDFYRANFAGATISPAAIPSIVAQFLRARRSGTIDRDGKDPTGLRWRPVDRKTVAQDRFYLAEYSDFCVKNSGVLPLGPTTQRGEELKNALLRVARRRQARDGDLLHHLADKRKGLPIFEVNIGDELVVRRSSSRSRLSPTLALVDAMIEEANSICQKMLLILAFFGGPRLSEELQIWRWDVLPGHLRKNLFPDDEWSGVPLVVLAHPSQSTFLGPFTKPDGDRATLLTEQYGLRPRNLLKRDPMRAGWKGMQFDNWGTLIAQVFWCDFARARQFYELSVRLRRETYPKIPSHVLNSHPYLLINDCPDRDEFGLPMKLSNARKVFQRAALQAGVDPDRFKDGSHAGRHFYKGRLEHLGMKATQIQKCMHHKWLYSQDDYNKEIVRLQIAMKNVMPGGDIMGLV